MKEKGWRHQKLLVMALTVVFLLSLPALAGAAPSYPYLERGDSGDGVVALQHLLRGWVNGALPVTGYFGSQTQGSVRQLQRDLGLQVDGRVGPETWSAILPTLYRGDRGEGVKALQALLRAKADGSLAVDGIFGAHTQGALIQYQKNRGITPDGIAGPSTWAILLGGYWVQDPGTGFIQLPAAGTGYYCYSSSSRTWGRPDVVQTIIEIARQWHQRHPDVPPIAVGDISLRQGGYLYPHASHKVGRDVDLATMINGDWSYNRGLTQELVNMFLATGKIEVIFFNDPLVKGVTYWPNHDNHLHVRFW